MVAAGEAGGILDTILKRLSVFIEKQAKLVSQLRSAMIYPAAVLSIAAIVVIVIMVKVVPTFTTLFEGLGAELPMATRMVIWMSKKMIVFLPFMVGGVMLGAYLVRRYYRTTAGRLRIDAMLLKMPLVGKIFRKVAVARFCRTLSTLLSSGVPILDGLDITAKTSGNAIIEGAIKQVRGRIERGETVAAPLRATGVFPPMVAQMIGAGESTGALDTMLSKIADFYEDEVDVAIAGLLTVLEPVLIAVLGVIVGTIVVAMYLPLFDLINQLS
jgi:type IV pilus assembly protein PilC